MLIAKGATDATSAVVLISLALVGLAFSWPVAWSLPVMYARSKAGLLSGFMNAWGQVAGILAPLITGAAAGSGSWGAPSCGVAGFTLMGAVLVAGTTRWSTDQAYHAKYPADGQAAITA